MTPPYDSSNGRVTNAILSTKLDALTIEVQRLCEKTDRRIAYLEEKHDIRIGTLDAHCQDLDTKVARLDERQKAWTGILGAMTMIGTTIGSAFGFLK